MTTADRPQPLSQETVELMAKVLGPASASHKALTEAAGMVEPRFFTWKDHIFVVETVGLKLNSKYDLVEQRPWTERFLEEQGW